MPSEVGCQSVTNAFIYETGRIGPDLFQRSALQRPIVGLIGSNRGVWPHDMGWTVSNLMFERAFSTSTTNPWVAMAPSDGSTNSCLPAVTQVTFGQTQQTFGPEQFALQTQYFCIKDILADTHFARVLEQVKKALAARTSWEWARKWTADYVSLAGHNITMTLAGPFDNGSAGYSTTNLPTAGLDMGVLQTIFAAQNREGSSVQRYSLEDTGSRAGEIIVSDETYRYLIERNQTLADRISYAWMGAKDDMPTLPGGIPKRRQLFGNWVVHTDPYPRRFAFSAGAYVEIPVWVSSSTTKGNKQTINPAWLAAPYEESIVYHPDNFRSLAYNTMTNPSPTWKFDPINSMGDWVLRNILERDCNPRGDQVFWDAVFADVAEPINAEVGYSILHLRCGYPIEPNNCYDSYDSAFVPGVPGA